MASSSDAGASASSEGDANETFAAWREAEAKGKKVLDHIQELRAKQEAKRLEKKALSRELRNAVRQRQRLRKRARLLSQEDLFEVLALRGFRAEKQKGKLAAEQPASEEQPAEDDKET